MNEPGLRDEIISLVTPDLFAFPQHKPIFSAITELLDAEKEPLLLAVCDRLEEMQSIEKIGGTPVRYRSRDNSYVASDRRVFNKRASRAQRISPAKGNCLAHGARRNHAGRRR